MRIVEKHFDDLTHQRYSHMVRSLGVSLDDIREAAVVLSELNLRPGVNLSETNSNIPDLEAALQQVAPDLVVGKIDGEYIVQLSDGSLPHLRISPLYRSLLSRPGAVDEKAVEYIKDKLDSAKWLINAIHKRRSTIIRVTDYIVKAQRDFFEHGPGHLKPLILKDVADAIGVHPATVSRVTTNKYIQTPHGTFELKYFFTGKIGTDDGEAIATQSLKMRIRRMIEGEDPDHPLSDYEIARILNAEGIEVARRTIAKYREEMNINPVKYRKGLFKDRSLATDSKQ